MKFSILVPAYKSQFLAECIESVLLQTYQDWELIIVNDASPFNLDEIVERYNDVRIRYYKNDRGCGAENVVENWNKCLSYAKGDYVICMGDDDKLLTNCLEMYDSCIRQNPYYKVYHIRMEVINPQGDIENLQETRPHWESVYSMIWHKFSCKRIQVLGEFLFERKDLIANGGFYYLPYACFSDDISAYRAARDLGIINIDKIGFQYRNHGQTISNTQNLRETVESVNKAMAWIESMLINAETKDHVEELYRIFALRTMPSYKSDFCLNCIRMDLNRDYRIGINYWKDKYFLYGISKQSFKSTAKSCKKKYLQDLCISIKRIVKP